MITIKTLTDHFKEFNRSKRLASAKKRTLLAVSGGVDSVVMCHVFAEAGFPFGIAHCNFKLRGEESDGDQKFVEELAARLGVEVYVTSFDTKQYAEEKGLSIQVAARELRYTFFEQIRKQHNYDLIATAHHLNDNVETILYNMLKGTGIRGLRGIPVRQGNIIRPLLFAKRDKIDDHAFLHQFPYRNDSSNKDDKYARNTIRNQVIPLLKQLNPSLEQTFADKIELFTELEEMYLKNVRKEAKQLFLPRGNDIYIPIQKLRKTKNAGTVLYEYLKDHGFNGEQVEDMLAALDSTPGKQFISNTARVIKDRKFFILTQLSDKEPGIQLIQENDKEILLGNKKLTFSVGDKIKADKNLAFIDKAKLEYPLTLRRWQQGDYFYPFGMKLKKKKLKKFFTDEKVPLNEKENAWVLESNKKIVWVVGYRIDERFKVTEKTKEVVRIKFE